MLNAIISISEESSVILPQIQDVALGGLGKVVILAKVLEVIVQPVQIKNVGADQLQEPIVTRKLKL